jgi:hypothetical protein
MSGKGGLCRDRPEAQAICEFPRDLRLTRPLTNRVSALPFFGLDPQETAVFVSPR